MNKSKSKIIPDLSIVIPAYREEKRIGKTLDELSGFINDNKTLKDLNIEVIIVSADSNDKTHKIIESKFNKFVSIKLLKPGPKVGKGRDVQFGMLRAKGRIIVFMDADLATPLHHIPEFYKHINKGGYDIVIATRDLLQHHPSKLRRFISYSGNLLFRIAGGVWIEDSQCGFKMFTKEAIDICFPKMTLLGWGFDMEILAIAKVNDLKIESVRVSDWVSVPDGSFVDSIAKNAISSLKDLSKVFFRRITGKYNR